MQTQLWNLPAQGKESEGQKANFLTFSEMALVNFANDQANEMSVES